MQEIMEVDVQAERRASMARKKWAERRRMADSLLGMRPRLKPGPKQSMGVALTLEKRAEERWPTQKPEVLREAVAVALDVLKGGEGKLSAAEPSEQPKRRRATEGRLRLEAWVRAALQEDPDADARELWERAKAERRTGVKLKSFRNLYLNRIRRELEEEPRAQENPGPPHQEAEYEPTPEELSSVQEELDKTRMLVGEADSYLPTPPPLTVIRDEEYREAATSKDVCVEVKAAWGFLACTAREGHMELKVDARNGVQVDVLIGFLQELLPILMQAAP